MLVKTPGIVIRNTKYSESSVISRIYTRQLGMQAYMINGVRSPKAAIKPSLLQPLVLLDLVVYNNPTKEIQRIREAKSHPILNTLHFDVVKSTIGLFIAELIFRSVREEEPNHALYDFLSSFILLVDHDEQNLGVLPVYFSLQLSRFLGFFPQSNWSKENAYFNLTDGRFNALPDRAENTIDPEHTEYLHLLMHADLNDLPNLRVPRSSRLALLNGLMDYYLLHIPSFQPLKSLSVLTGLLRD